MEKSHAEFLKMAIQIATENINGGGGPFGAVIVKNGPPPPFIFSVAI